MPLTGAAERSLPADRRGSGYAWFVVALLMVAYTLSFIDRQILSLLVQPIRAELGITDTQVALLQGLAFAVFYTVLGLPMGWVVDRFSRRNLIVGGVGLWSVMTALCGGALSFPALFLARMGVGVGEATLTPAALSMITDYFPREKLGTAISFYSMGIFLGAGLAFLAGGGVVAAVAHLPPLAVPWLGALSSWRLAFLIVGLPGLLVAALILAVQEPVRTGLLVDGQDRTAALSVREAAREIRGRWRSIAGISAGMALQAICLYGVFAWVPTAFVRRFGWTAGHAGSTLGVVVLVFGCAGMLAGGRLRDRWQARGARAAPLRVGVAGVTLAGITLVASTLAGTPAAALAWLAPAVCGLALPIGSLFSALQVIVPNQVRGQVCALYLFVISFVGISLGPLLPAMLSDRWFARPASIGESLAITVAVASAAAALAFRCTYAAYEADYGRMAAAEASRRPTMDRAGVR